MATSKQAKKRIRTSEKAREANKGVRGSMKSAVKKVTQAATLEQARAELALAMKRVDKAAKKGVIHRNAAARKKSQLSRALGALVAK
jgi:small subunit ribosomal protein S20